MVYGLVTGGLAATMQGYGDAARDDVDAWDAGTENAWRHRVAAGLAIGLWLLTWLAGWSIGRWLSSGSFVLTVAGACCGWCVGLAIATLVLYLDECL